MQKPLPLIATLYCKASLEFWLLWQTGTKIRRADTCTET